MAKFHGMIGYVVEPTVTGGVVTENVMERKAYGDFEDIGRRLDNSDAINDTVVVTNRISIVADAYARAHVFAMRYVVWQGSKWRIASVTANYPRLILTLGGVYNGESATT